MRAKDFVERMISTRRWIRQSDPWAADRSRPAFESASHETAMAFLFGPPGSSRRCPPKERRDWSNSAFPMHIRSSGGAAMRRKKGS